jgi:biopolymer transport protein ExbD
MRKTGSGIAVKADRTTPFSMVNEVLENLRTIKLNKFTVMTALKTEND